MTLYVFFLLILQPKTTKAVKRNVLVIRLFVALCCMIPLVCQAQEIRIDSETDRAMTGDPIFAHGLYYTGMVEYEGEMIPSFLYADYYVFGKLVFKNKRL